MASANFTNLAKHILDGNTIFDGSTHSYKCLLVSGAGTVLSNLDAWNDRADVTNEVTGTGYTAGGVAVTHSQGAVNTTDNSCTVTFGNLAPGWASSTITAEGAIIYRTTGVAANDLLVAFVDFGGAVASTSGDFNITFTSGLTLDVG